MGEEILMIELEIFSPASVFQNAFFPLGSCSLADCSGKATSRRKPTAAIIDNNPVFAPMIEIIELLPSVRAT